MLNLKKWGGWCWVSSGSGWLLELLTELINNNQKAHFESGLDPVGCWSQLFKNLFTLLVSENIRSIQRQRLFVSENMAIRLDKVKDTLHILKNVVLIVIFTSKNDLSKQSHEVHHIQDNCKPKWKLGVVDSLLLQICQFWFHTSGAFK